MATRKPYPSDVSDQEWAFVAPYLALVREDAPQRDHDLREVFNGLRWVVRTGSPWRSICPTTCLRGRPSTSRRSGGSKLECSSRWSTTCAYFCAFRRVVHPARRPRYSSTPAPTLRSTTESGSRGGYDGAKRKKGSKVHAAVDTTLGNLLALHVSPASEQEREHVGRLAQEAVQEATGESVELAYVDQGYTGERAAEEAEAHGMRLEVVKHEEAKRGFVLLPRRWVVERDFAWASRFRRLAKDY
jgi:transposase